MDEMEADGLLVRPEDHGILLTHVHDSYLVPKVDDVVLRVSTGLLPTYNLCFRILNQPVFLFPLLRNHSGN